MTTPIRSHRRLLQFAILLAFAVIGLGAWVRLSDAGLACPDWPACYGSWTNSANWPDPQRSGLEMLHRYVAGGLGLVVMVLAWQAWRLRPAVDPALPLLLVLLVGGQALLGQLTVSQQLAPLIVTAHLAGGMSTLSLLVWQRLRLRLMKGRWPAAPSQPWAALALSLIAGQIILGGWVSSHAAGLACTGFPRCNGAWWPTTMDWSLAFAGLASHSPHALPLDTLTGIHWLHRLGGLLVLLVVGRLALRLLGQPGRRQLGILLGLAVAAQFALGVANVELLLPPALAVAHNLGAAVLLMLALITYFQLTRSLQASPSAPATGWAAAH